MSDDAVVETPEDCDVPVKGGSRSHAALVHEEVNKILAERSATVVRERVVNDLVEAKLEERKKLVMDAMGKFRQAQQELQQLRRKGEQKFTVDEQGKSIPCGEMTFTKQQGEEIKKQVDKVRKLESALDKALGEGDYTKLAEVCK